jgi:alpha-1,2-mannosyltransferase
MWGAALEAWLARDTALRRHGPWVGLAVAAAAYYRRFAKDTVGMEVYPQGGECVLHGEPLRICAELFSYPPAFAFLMAPFSWMPMGPRIVVWYLISLAATVGCFWVSEKLVMKLLPGRWSQIELAWLRIVTVIVSLKFVLAVFEYQAYDTLAAFIVFLGLWGVVQNRAFVSGALLALAAAIKATPLVFLPYLVVKRRFLAAAIFIAVFMALWLSPDAYNALKGLYPHYLENWIRQIVTPALTHEQTGASFWQTWMGANILNHSFRGTVARMVAGTPAAVHGEAMLYTLCAVYVAFVGLLMLRSARRDDFVAIDGSILVISMLLLSPMTSRYHYILLILPYMTVIGLAVRDRSLRGAAIVTMALSFILGTATSNDIAGHFMTEWSYQHNFLVLSALVLLVFLAFVIVRNDVRQASPAAA